MRFGILGPLEVIGERGPVALDGIKPRAVLAMLLLHANEPVSAERLAVALWGEDAPPSATRAVQVYVSRLRKALGDPGLVATTPAGYRLRVGPDELDATRFEREVEDGRRALLGGSPARASMLLRDALGMWRGPPLAELEFESFAHSEIARLEEQRLAALEARAEADLAAGHDAAALVSELRQLVDEHPTRERLVAHLMLALYRCGRQTEALDVYREARGVLVEQAGVEPGPELRRMHESVLGQDPSLDPPVPDGDLTTELGPRAAPPLSGRNAELARLREHWEAARAEAERRVDTSAWRTAARRAELRSTEAELADDVRELRVAQDHASSVLEDGGLVRCPFKGLASFDVADAPYFFGRERLVAEMVARLVGARLLGVVGPSGSGKSSVMRAGLLPALAAGVLPGSADWAQAVMRPGEHPQRELARATASVEAGRPMVLAVDQFEETFTACREEAERAAFIAELVAHDRPGVVVLAVRADAYGRCAVYPRLSQLLATHHVLVSDMRRDELRRAVERPARRVGLHVEPALTDALLADVEQEPGALPMLSTALLELWQRRDGRTLPLAMYEVTGGVRGAVARHAESAFSRLDPAQQTVARSVLLRLAAESAGGAVERRRVPLAELAAGEPAAEVVELLAEQRLLTLSSGTVEVAHEALLREWPRLRGWLEEDAEGRRLHRHLGDAAREWDEHGRDDAELYRGARLAAASEWRARHEPDLNRTERDFLDAALAELLAVRARRRRSLTLAAAVLIVITGISTVLAVRGIQRARFEQRAADSRALATNAAAHLQGDVALAGLLGLEALRREPTIEARTAALSALAALSDYHRLGLPLVSAGIDKLAISPDGTTLATTDDAAISFWDLDTRRRLGSPVPAHAGPIEDLAFSPDGTLLASIGAGATVELWDAVAHQPLGRLRSRHVDDVSSLAFSPDGRTLASSGIVGSLATTTSRRATLQLWDVATRRPLGAPLRTETPGVDDMQFSPDGRLLATAGTGTMRLWDVAARRPLGPPLPGPLGEVYNAVAFSPDGATLAGGASDSTVRLWRVGNHRPLGGPLEGHTGNVNGVAFSPDGRTLASGGDDATIRLWSVATRRPQGVLVTDTDRPATHDTSRVAGVVGVAFTRAGILVSGDEQGDVRLWNSRGHRPLSRVLRGHTGWIRAIVFTGPGTVASTGLDRTVRLWDVRTGRPVAGTLHLSAQALAMAAAPDGRTLAVAGAGDGRSGMLEIWDLRSGRRLHGPVTGHDGTVMAVAYSPDGRTLASGGEDGTVRLWDAGSGRSLGPPLDAGAGPVNGVAFAPDGKSLATAEQDGTVHRWDVDAHRALGPPLRGPTGFLAAVAFAPDGKVIAAAGGDGSVWLWDAKTGQLLGAPLTGHTDVVSALSFSADGRTLASAGADHTVRLWDVQSGRTLGLPLVAHTGWVSAVAFGPDDNVLVSGGGDATLRLWDPILWRDDVGALAHRLCDGIQRSLSRAEWAEFIPDRPYHATCPGSH